MRNDSGKGWGKLYGIGIGPGDPELITVKGLRLLDEADTVFVPAGRLQDGSLARDILARAGCDVSEWRELEFPMVTEKKTLREKWALAAAEVAETVKGGNDAAFVTLGDPSVYSTWIYLSEGIKEINPDAKISVVPGIQTMSAAAAAFALPLVRGKERLVLMPVPDDASEIEEIFRLVDTVVFYKIGDRLARLRDVLEGLGYSNTAWFIQRVGLEDQFLAAGLDNLLPRDRDGYLSAMIVRKNPATSENESRGKSGEEST